MTPLDVSENRDWAGAEARAHGLPPVESDKQPEASGPRPVGVKSKPRPKPSQPERHLVARPASEVKMERTEWLWEQRIPFGEVTLALGLPGIGKSMLSVWLAAQNSLGQLAGERGVTLMATAEDSPERTVVPRLRAWDADLSRVRFVHIVTEHHGQELHESVVLPGDTGQLREAAEALGANLLVVDPLMAHLDTAVDSYRDQAVRAALTPLYFVARDLGLAVVALLHLNKNPGTNALLRTGGSIGIPAAARSALLLARDPDDPEGEQGTGRVLAHVKCNVGPEAPSLLYEIEPILIQAADGEPEIETARIEECGESDLTGSDLLAPPKGASSKLEEAEDFLREILADGAKDSQDVKEAAGKAGIAEKTLRKARERLRLTISRGDTGRTSWGLPELGAPARGHEDPVGTKGTKVASPSPEPSVSPRAPVGQEGLVPLPGGWARRGHEDRPGGSPSGNGSLADEQIADVLLRHLGFDHPEWHVFTDEDDLYAFVAHALSTETGREVTPNELRVLDEGQALVDAGEARWLDDETHERS